MTVIASVFVPISLASSIFGMNVQQINQSGHSVWAFVVCALVMWLITGAVWAAWQAKRNLKIASHRARSDWEDHDWNGLSRREKLHWAAELYMDIEGRFGRLLYYLGLRRLEKSGRSNAVV